MVKPMRDKVLAAFGIYYEGGTIAAARKAAGLSSQQFYDTLHDNPDLWARYKHICKARGHMFADQAVGIADAMGTDTVKDFRSAREQAKTYLELAGKYNKEDFGDKLAITVEAPPSVYQALEDGRRRALLPSRDLAALPNPQAIDAEYTIPATPRDTQSRAPEKAPVFDPIGLLDD